MATILPSEVLFLLSAPMASAGYANMGTAGISWGGWASTTTLSTTAQNNLFPDVTGAENASGYTDYACVFIANNTVSGHSMTSPTAWLPTLYATPGGVTVSIAVDPAAASPLTSGTFQAARITQGTLPPPGVTGWVGTSASSAGGVAIGDIAPGYTRAVWIRRVAVNGAAVNAQTIGIEVDFTSLS